MKQSKRGLIHKNYDNNYHDDEKYFYQCKPTTGEAEVRCSHKMFHGIQNCTKQNKYN
jgi:hypothetical protein